ncbi:MAG: tetratricopeptide repeat protein [Gemmatimonadota bacterium]|nr:MAG: tetratricopeptide repeat protein [Gemmatimonadota bacterium]
MSPLSSGIRSFLAELKRRKVYRVAVVYVIVGFAVIEGGQLIFDALEFPRAAWQFVVVLTLLGFPIALVLAWALELTPEGIRVTPPAEPPDGAAGDQAPTGAPATEPAKPATVGGPSDDRPCVVVLPFANLSGDPENEFFSDGVTEDIMARLAGIRGLRVISRTTAMRYKGSDLSLPQIGAELGAHAVVEGTVRRSADRVRVTAQLIAAERDEHLWAETYDRVLEDVFAVQSDVAENIARALHAELTPGERQRLQRKPTENLEAYDLCLKGMRTTGSIDPEALRRSEGYFQQAIALDPGYARAYAGLAMTLVFKGYIANVPPAELFPQLRAMANEALRLDPDLGEAHAALASLAFWYEWDWAKVERELETALQLNPYDQFALAFKGFSLLVRERFPEAEAAFREALRIDPHYPIGNVDLAQLSAFTGKADEGVAILDGVLRREPRTYDARLWRGICQLYSENLGEAANDFEQAISLVGRLPVAIMFRGLVHAFGGETERARQILEELRARAKEEYVDPYFLFSLCHSIDGFDAALPYLEQMLEVRSRHVTYLRVAPRYRELRSEPRFVNVLRTIWPDDF